MFELMFSIHFIIPEFIFRENNLEKLSEKKGYNLVYVDSRGVNAFFVRKDVMENSVLRKMKSGDVFIYNKDHNTRLKSIKNIVKKYNLLKV